MYFIKINMKALLTLFLMMISPAFSVAHNYYDLTGRAPDLLGAVAFRESLFHTDTLNLLSDEKYVVSLMQLYSQSFNALSVCGIHKKMLKHVPCMNSYTQDYYLVKFIRSDKNIWRNVDAYKADRKKNSKQKQRRYKNEIYVMYKVLTISNSLLIIMTHHLAYPHSLLLNTSKL